MKKIFLNYLKRKRRGARSSMVKLSNKKEAEFLLRKLHALMRKVPYREGWEELADADIALQTAYFKMK